MRGFPSRARGLLLDFSCLLRGCACSLPSMFSFIVFENTHCHTCTARRVVLQLETSRLRGPCAPSPVHGLGLGCALSPTCPIPLLALEQPLNRAVIVLLFFQSGFIVYVHVLGRTVSHPHAHVGTLTPGALECDFPRRQSLFRGGDVAAGPWG